MPTEAQGEVTRLLEEIAAGNEEAKKALFELVYADLRQMARARISRARPGTWDSAELANEVIRRLLESPNVFKKDRRYFFGSARQAMKWVLGGNPPIDSDPNEHDLLCEVVAAIESSLQVDLLDLMSALEQLEATGKFGKRRHDVVRLRFWDDLTFQEVAEKLGVSVATVERDWLAARAWLYGRLKGGRTDE